MTLPALASQHPCWWEEWGNSYDPSWVVHLGPPRLPSGGTMPAEAPVMRALPLSLTHGMVSKAQATHQDHKKGFARQG